MTVQSRLLTYQFGNCVFQVDPDDIPKDEFTFQLSCQPTATLMTGEIQANADEATAIDLFHDLFDQPPKAGDPLHADVFAKIRRRLGIRDHAQRALGWIEPNRTDPNRRATDESWNGPHSGGAV